MEDQPVSVSERPTGQAADDLIMFYYKTWCDERQKARVLRRAEDVLLAPLQTVVDGILLMNGQRYPIGDEDRQL